MNQIVIASRKSYYCEFQKWYAHFYGSFKNRNLIIEKITYDFIHRDKTNE